MTQKKLHKEMNFLLLKDLYRFKLCLLIFDIKNNNNKSAYLKQIVLQLRNEVHKYNTRHSSLLVTDKISSKVTIENAAKKEFNSLPTHIAQCKNRLTFKSDLKTFFISKY